MQESIIVAVITGLFSFFGVLFTNRKTVSLLEYRLNQLEEKQDKHNQVIERTYAIEARLAAIEERTKQ